MPRMDGFEASQKIMEMMEMNPPVIVALSGLCDEETSQKCNDIGIRSLLSKPPRQEEIDSLIEETLSNSPLS